MLGVICIFSINGWGHCSVLQIMGIELDPIDKRGSAICIFVWILKKKKLSKRRHFRTLINNNLLKGIEQKDLITNK